ncbi:hypothetical protein QVD17_37782 [Tagetes erecta]|uniref:Uncharacterized protein n=1 Tax=Tagetes erecta TaxID=13708 RepID=A0AAD8K163_TARER|nr:hypothetical protein QVD17_37782 [Tagetes erecta]
MVLLVSLTRVHSPPPLLVVTRRRQLWSPATTSCSINPSSPTLHLRFKANNRRWDSNAETFRTNNFDFDDDSDDFQDDDDDDDDWLDVLENFIDGVWIFKVFRSFGWMLPAIISSLLLTSGIKAFLLALAIPMGQSALSLLFQTVWGKPKTKTRRQGKSRRKQQPQPPPQSPPRGASYMDIEDEQEEYVKGERKRATGYQTWVAGDGSSDNKTNGSSSSFGGWEELDERKTRFNKDGNRKQSKSKMSRRVKRSETPLLLRLLIAVFPFLGSWTKLL